MRMTINKTLPMINKLICFKPKTECLVIKAFNGNLLVTIDEKVYELKKLEKNASMSEALNEIAEKIETKRIVHIPPMTHPWKAASFKKQMQKAHTRKVYA